MKVQRSDGWLMFLQNVMALRVREDCDVRRILLDGWYWNFQNCEVRHSTQFDSFLVAFSPYQEVMSFMSSIGQTNEWSLLETMGERLLQQYYRCTFFCNTRNSSIVHTKKLQQSNRSRIIERLTITRVDSEYYNLPVVAYNRECRLRRLDLVEGYIISFMMMFERGYNNISIVN